METGALRTGPGSANISHRQYFLSSVLVEHDLGNVRVMAVTRTLREGNRMKNRRRAFFFVSLAALLLASPALAVTPEGIGRTRAIVAASLP